MADDRIFDAFSSLDRPIQPDGAFAERLFEDLAVDLGFRPVSRRQAIMRRFGDRSATFRLVYIAAMLGLLLAAAVVASIVGGQLLRDATALDIVHASQATQLDPPAYDMTISADDRRIARVRTDGEGAWRWDRIVDPEVPAGMYEVQAAGRSGAYDPVENTWTVSVQELPRPNLSLLDWTMSPFSAATSPTPEWFDCPDWRRLPDEVVAGRPAYHLACSEREFWVDEASSLLVGVLTPAGQELASMSGRATELDVEPSFPPDTFALTAPEGAVAIDPNDPPPSTVLARGRHAPRLVGVTMDGEAVDTALGEGPLVVYFWATWCEPCLGARLTELQAVALRHEGSIVTVTIATEDEADAVSRHVEENDIRLPVIIDDGSMRRSWGLLGIPALVVLEPDGTVAAIRVGLVSPEELEQVYGALAAGIR